MTNISYKPSPVCVDITSLSNIKDTSFDGGTTATVDGYVDNFYLDKTSTAGIDHIAVFPTRSGTGRWLRRIGASSNNYASITNWYISASGTTTGLGTTPSDPITAAELSRRLKGVTLNIIGAMTVHYDAAGDPNGVLDVSWNIPINCQTFIVGTPTSSGVTGTCTTWINAVTTTSPSSYGFTDSALPANNSFSALVGSRIRITSGPRAGLCMSIMKDQSTNTMTPAVNKTARIAPPFTAGPLTYPYLPFSATLTVPVIGDSYVVESVPNIGSIQFTGKIDYNFSDNIGSTRIILKDISTTVESSVVLDRPFTVTFVDCNINFIYAVAPASVILLGGSSQFINLANGAQLTAFGHGVGTSGWSAANGVNIVFEGVLFQTHELDMREGSKGSISSTGGLSIWDDFGGEGSSGGYGLLLQHAFLRVSGPLYGVNQGGAQIIDGSWLLWDPGFLPTITGAYGGNNTEWLVDAHSAGSWASLPNGSFRDRLTGSTIGPRDLGNGAEQSAMAEATDSPTLTSSTFADIPGMTITFTSPGTSQGFMIISLTLNASALTHDAIIQLVVDGVAKRGGDISATAVNGCVCIVYRMTMSLISHVIKAQYKIAAGGTLQIRPSTHIEESGQLVVWKSSF